MANWTYGLCVLGASMALDLVMFALDRRDRRRVLALGGDLRVDAELPALVNGALTGVSFVAAIFVLEFEASNGFKNGIFPVFSVFFLGNALRTGWRWRLRRTKSGLKPALL
jgi:hypothetical protein